MNDIKQLFEKACKKEVSIEDDLLFSEQDNRLTIEVVGSDKKIIFEGGSLEQRYVSLLRLLIRTTIRATKYE